MLPALLSSLLVTLKNTVGHWRVCWVNIPVGVAPFPHQHTSTSSSSPERYTYDSHYLKWMPVATCDSKSHQPNTSEPVFAFLSKLVGDCANLDWGWQWNFTKMTLSEFEFFVIVLKLQVIKLRIYLLCCTHKITRPQTNKKINFHLSQYTLPTTNLLKGISMYLIYLSCFCANAFIASLWQVFTTPPKWRPIKMVLWRSH